MLSLSVQRKVDQVLDMIIIEMIKDLNTRNMTGYGPSVATGKTIKSIKKVLNDEGGHIEIGGQIVYLIEGRPPGKFTPAERDSINDWLVHRGLMAYKWPIIKSIEKKGTLIYRKYAPGESGLFSDVFGNNLIERLNQMLTPTYTAEISSQIIKALQGA